MRTIRSIVNWTLSILPPLIFKECWKVLFATEQISLTDLDGKNNPPLFFPCIIRNSSSFSSSVIKEDTHVGHSIPPLLLNRLATNPLIYAMMFTYTYVYLRIPSTDRQPTILYGVFCCSVWIASNDVSENPGFPSTVRYQFLIDWSQGRKNLSRT